MCHKHRSHPSVNTQKSQTRTLEHNGLRAFVGKSAGYPTFNTETIDLGTRYANQTILLRFRIGADDAAAAIAASGQ